MRIVLAGASGFLGTHLVRQLTGAGHAVIRLVRRKPGAADERAWDPDAGLLDSAALAGAGAVVNLAGASVARLWTEQYRQTIRTSRVTTTSTLATALAALSDDRPHPRVLLNASAIGFYGDTGDQAVDESSPAGTGFLAGVCRDWEAATQPAEEVGIRVVHLRTGLPLAAGGGLLKPLLPLFRAGLGGRMGDGRQYWPWISLVDWLGAVQFLLEDPPAGQSSISGPVNLVGPAPATNAEFVAALGRVLRRPAVLPAPASALRLALGGFAAEVLDSHRVLPTVLSETGFRFQHSALEPALRAALS
ncbi:MAG: TIGR01777 family oxidoreductase [Micromonosporaceae bacterium]|nr:TIGR01777 family oxidoreductase [Micromonosporaceae bacterium]